MKSKFEHGVSRLYMYLKQSKHILCTKQETKKYLQFETKQLIFMFLVTF